MEVTNLDRIAEAEKLVEGLLDLILTIQTGKQDVLIPLTILTPFGTVLQKVHSLLEETERNMGDAMNSVDMNC